MFSINTRVKSLQYRILDKNNKKPQMMPIGSRILKLTSQLGNNI